MEEYHIDASTRTVKGKQVKQIRLQKKLPVILYGAGIEPKILSVDKTEFDKLYHETGGSSLVKLHIDSEKEPVNVLFHHIDRDPMSDSIIHADLLQVKLTEKIKAEINLVLVGEEDAPVVKEKEGTIVLNKDSIEVEAFPQDLVSEIEIDASQLSDFDQNIYVKNLKVPSTITVLDDPEELIVLIQEPRSEEELAELDTEVVEDVDKIEVEEKGKDDEEAADEAESDKDNSKDKE